MRSRLPVYWPSSCFAFVFWTKKKNAKTKKSSISSHLYCLVPETYSKEKEQIYWTKAQYSNDCIFQLYQLTIIIWQVQCRLWGLYSQFCGMTKQKRKLSIEHNLWSSVYFPSLLRCRIKTELGSKYPSIAWILTAMNCRKLARIWYSILE